MRAPVRQADIVVFQEAAKLCACFNLRQAARAVTSLYDDALRPVRLRATQFALLSITRVLGEGTVTQLARAAVMDRTTLTRNLRPLQRRGLISIRAGSDRRERQVSLTPRGRALWARAIPLWGEAQGHIADGLGQRRLRQLVSHLKATVAVTRRR